MEIEVYYYPDGTSASEQLLYKGLRETIAILQGGSFSLLQEDEFHIELNDEKKLVRVFRVEPKFENDQINLDYLIYKLVPAELILGQIRI